MIEHLFDSVKRGPTEQTLDAAIGPGPGWPENRALEHETESAGPASTRRMKRDTASLVVATLRTGLLVGFALILILILFPAAMAQAAGPR